MKEASKTIGNKNEAGITVELGDKNGEKIEKLQTFDLTYFVGKVISMMMVHKIIQYFMQFLNIFNFLVKSFDNKFGTREKLFSKSYLY